MRPESHTKNMEVPIKTSTEVMTCQAGGLLAKMAGITMGENKGKIEANTDRLEVGVSTALIMM